MNDAFQRLFKHKIYHSFLFSIYVIVIGTFPKEENGTMLVMKFAGFIFVSKKLLGLFRRTQLFMFFMALSILIHGLRFLPLAKNPFLEVFVSICELPLPPLFFFMFTMIWQLMILFENVISLWEFSMIHIFRAWNRIVLAFRGRRRGRRVRFNNEVQYHYFDR